MPKEACRIFLQIESISIERLHEISAKDIKAEGVPYTIDYYPALFELWENLWTIINRKESWESNPFVWVIAFKRIEQPK